MNKVLEIDMKIADTLIQLENKEIDFGTFDRRISYLNKRKMEINEREVK